MIGEVVGNYRIASQIGSGGMGAVYEAHHELLGKTAAIKVLLPERSANREIVQRFFNEARAVSTVHHPGIPEIFDFGHLPSGNAYIIMELLDGETLGDRLKRVRPMSAKEAVSISRHIAGVLGAAHAHGIVHRDLKPDNVFLVPDPALPRGERAKILDFGIAKLQQEERPSKVRTETGRLMGTPYYMSPEQCRGSGHVDHRSDIYSLGCVLYQMLTGRPPFVLEGSGEILAAHIHVPPLPPRSIVSSIPVTVEAVVMRLLAKDRDQRFQSMEEVIHALNTAVPRGTDMIDTEPSLQASSARMPAQTTTGSRSVSQDSYSGPTTLGSSASESMATIPDGRRSSSWLLYVSLIGVAAAASFAVAWQVLSNNNGKPEVSSAAAPTDRGEGTPGSAAKTSEGPEVVIDKRPVVRPIESATEVTLLVESEPDGVKVYREADGVFIGKTPVRYRVRRGQGDAIFILKKRGYRPERLVMGVEKDDAFMVSMTRKRGAGDAPPKPKNDAKASGASGTDDAAKKDPAKTDPPKTDPPDAPPEKPGKDDALDPFKFTP